MIRTIRIKFKNVALHHENTKRNGKGKNVKEIMNICRKACDFLKKHFVFEDKLFDYN